MFASCALSLRPGRACRGCLGGKGVSPDMKVMSGLYTDTDTLILIVQILPVSELLVEG